MGQGPARAAASITGTSLYSNGMDVADMRRRGRAGSHPGPKMPKWVRESSAVSGPECPATQMTLPILRSQSWASWLNSRMGPYFR